LLTFLLTCLLLTWFSTCLLTCLLTYLLTCLWLVLLTCLLFTCLLIFLTRLFAAAGEDQAGEASLETNQTTMNLIVEMLTSGKTDIMFVFLLRTKYSNYQNKYPVADSRSLYIHIYISVTTLLIFLKNLFSFFSKNDIFLPLKHLIFETKNTNIFF